MGIIPYNNGQLIAWGQNIQHITGNASVSLKVATIAKAIVLKGAVYSPKTNRLSIPLRLDGIPGIPLSLADFETPEYKVSGGHIIEQSKLGVVVAPDKPDSEVAVEVEATALTAPHMYSVLKLEEPFRVVPKDLAAGEGQTINLYPANTGFLGGVGINATISNYPNDEIEFLNQTIYSETDLITLPDGITLANMGVLKPIKYVKGQDSGYLSGSGCLTDNSIEFLGVEVTLNWWTSGHKRILTTFGNPPTPVQYSNPNSPGTSIVERLMFSTKAVKVNQRCQVAGGRGIDMTNLDLKPGWNWVRHTYSGGGMAWGYATSFDSNNSSTFPDTRRWYAQISDASIGLDTDPVNPMMGSSFSYVLRVQPGNLYDIQSPSVLEGTLQYPSGQVQPMQTMMGDPNTLNGCFWKLISNQVNSDVIGFKCVFGTDKPLQIKIPFTAPKVQGPIRVFAQLESTTYLDLVPDNNNASLEFSPNQSTLGVFVDTEIPIIHTDSSTLLYARVGIPMVVSGTVQDNFDIEKVELYDGFKLLGEAGLQGQKSSKYTAKWLYSWTPWQTGATSLRIVAYDLAGNTSSSPLLVNVYSTL